MVGDEPTRTILEGHDRLRADGLRHLRVIARVIGMLQTTPSARRHASRIDS